MLRAEADPKRGPKHDALSLIPIAVVGLCPTAVLNFNLYLRPYGKKPPLLYRGRHYPLVQQDLDRLIERGVYTLFIRGGEQDAFQRYLHKELIQNEKVSPAYRYRVLREATRAIFEAAFYNRNLDRTVRVVGEFGNQLTRLLSHQNLLLKDLIALMDHDYYTYTHAVNVTTYSILLARGIGLSKPADLQAIAIGALLHDIGKRNVERKILCKPGNLDRHQRAIIQQHPKAGFEILYMRKDLNWGQLMMVYQHHERIDGQGYPVGLKGEEIHPWARLLSVADVSDALTTTRPYRQPLPFETALDYLQEYEDKSLDKEMIKCWSKTMQPCC